MHGHACVHALTHSHPVHLLESQACAARAASLPASGHPTLLEGAIDSWFKFFDAHSTENPLQFGFCTHSSSDTVTARRPGCDPPAGTEPGTQSRPLPGPSCPSAFGTRPPRGPSFPSPPQVPARHLQHRPGVAPATWPSCRLTPGCWGENSTGSDATEQEPQTGVKNQEEIQCHGEQTERERILWCVCSECQLRPSSERSMVARSLFILTVMQLSYRSTMRHLTLKITIFKSKIQKAPPLSNRV